MSQQSSLEQLAIADIEDAISYVNETQAVQNAKKSWLYKFGYKLGGMLDTAKRKARTGVDTLNRGVSEAFEDLLDKVVQEQEQLYRKKLKKVRWIYLAVSAVVSTATFLGGVVTGITWF